MATVPSAPPLSSRPLVTEAWSAVTPPPAPDTEEAAHSCRGRVMLLPVCEGYVV